MHQPPHPASASNRRFLMGRTMMRAVAVTLTASVLAACGMTERLADVGRPPALSPIENPITAPGYQPVSMPMPAPEIAERQSQSLWRPGSRAFFRDQRAQRVGDLLTVVIEISDQADINNTSSRSRSNDSESALNAFLGYEADLAQVFPETIDNTSLTDFGSDTANLGTGAVDREEDISVRVAALITQVLPNGNMVIQGRQEVRVNFELRELLVAGIIRPEDVRADNTIAYDQIAEARISYGGRGQITDVQQPRYGDQIYDILMPF